MLRLAADLELIKASSSNVIGCLNTAATTMKGEFSTFIADSAWSYRDKATRGAAENHYPTMSMEEIRETFRLASALLADNAHVHLWTTTSFIAEALTLFPILGATYKSQLIWCKTGNLGMGHYWRIGHEILLTGIKGKCPFKMHNKPSWVCLPRERHSQKPFEFNQLITEVSPPPYLELFARRTFPHPDWYVWGNEVSASPRSISLPLFPPETCTRKSA